MIDILIASPSVVYHRSEVHMKLLGLAAAGLGLLVGFLAAWLWLCASKVPLHFPGDWAYDSPGEADFLVALLKSGEESARLNRQAALWTAITVALSAIATFLLALPIS